jgi:hypothetical protein
VTDLAEENLRLDFNAMREKDGSLSTARIAWAALCRPRGLGPEVFKLYQRSRLAAHTLGDFLAECSF